LVSEREARLDAAAQELAVIGKHLYLVTDEALDEKDWNNDSDQLDLVLLHTTCENASPTTLQYVATLARTGSGPHMLASDNDRLFFTEDPSADPLTGNETSIDMIKLASGAPLAPQRLLNEDGLTTLQPLLMTTKEDIVFALLDETIEGRDSTGTPTRTDGFVLALFDSTSNLPQIKSVGLALENATSPVAALDTTNGETVVAFLVDEAAQGGLSLNDYIGAFANWRPSYCTSDDTDATDQVLHFLWFDTWFHGSDRAAQHGLRRNRPSPARQARATTPSSRRSCRRATTAIAPPTSASTTTAIRPTACCAGSRSRPCSAPRVCSQIKTGS
jgi:hypothetical protein